MPRRHRTPSYRLHKPTGQAVVTIDGRDHYLGLHDTPKSRAAYDRLIGEWLASGRAAPPAPSVTRAVGRTVDEILLAYWHHAEGYYRTPDGAQTKELDNIKHAIRPVHKLYGTKPAAAFGPLALRAVRDEMVRSGLARTTVNARVHRVRRVFRWAASVEMIPAGVVEALDTVEALEEGRTPAPEPPEIQPVPIEHVEAALPHMPPTVAAMVRLQLLTGARTGEILIMRGCDLAPGETTWDYRPATHKNAWRGQKRMIALGPKAREIVKAFLTPDLGAYLFSPRAAVAAIQAERRASRKSKPTPSELARRADRPGATRGERYNRRSYRQAIIRACKRAGVPAWTPLQLRHTRGTEIRRAYGLEAAQVVLGHAKADTTEIYAERDAAKAREIMAAIG
jgi:integrase